MLTLPRRWLWVFAGCLAVACGLNPQPDLPVANGSTSGNDAGGSATVPSAGKGSVNLGGTPSSTAGTGAGGTFGQAGSAAAGKDSGDAGADSGGQSATGGDGGGNEAGQADGGGSGENSLGAGNHG